MRKTRRRKAEGSNKWMWFIIIVLLLVIALGINMWKPWEEAKAWEIKQLIPWLDSSKETDKTGDAAPVDRTDKQKDEGKGSETKNSEEAKTSVKTTEEPPSKTSKVISSATGLVKVNDENKSLFDKLDKMEIAASTKFSLNDWLKTNGIEKSSVTGSENLSYLGSLLYEAAVKAGVTIGERHVHLKLPDYASPGFDVFIEPEDNDLTFVNGNKFPVTVHVSYSDELPAISLEGSPPSNWTALQVQVKETKYLPDKLVLTDSRLAGAPVEKETGSEGYIFEVMDEQRNVISRDFYNPEPVVVWQAHNVQ